MMNRFIVIAFLTLSSVISYAQSTKVQGIICDSLSKQGEPAAIIQFFEANELSNPIAYTTTDENGRFQQLIIGQGNYRMTFNNMGRKSKAIDFVITDQREIDLGEILVEDDVEVLKTASVTAQKNLVVMDADKITYKVEDDMDSQTSNLLDMLRKVPMVSVDAQDNITVNGSSSFMVYVDGKPNPMMTENASLIFKMTPASYVKNIEIITNPGAKYDAEGVGGVLNITTNAVQTGDQEKNDGVYGNVTATGSQRGVGTGVLMTTQKGKWAMSLSGNALYNNMDGTSVNIDRTQSTEAGEIHTLISSVSDMRTPVYTGNLNMSYELDSQNLFSMGTAITHIGATTDGPLSTAVNSPYMEYSYSGNTLTKVKMSTITANADYQHLWKDAPERSLIISYQFSGTPAATKTENTFEVPVGMPFDLANRMSDVSTNSLSHTAQVDFSTPLTAGHTLSTGLKFIGRHNFSDSKDYVEVDNVLSFNPLSSLQYNFFNNIGAAYAEYAGVVRKVSFKAGVRYEYTWQKVTYSEGDGEDFRLGYGNLVPSASIQYNITQNQNIGLTYNLRISRPGITYLNPYVNTSDATALTYGNPNLIAEKGHNLSFIYNYFSPKWIANITFRQVFTGNGISDYSFYDESNLLNTTYGNIISTSNTGINAFITWIPGQKTRVMVNGGASYVDIRSKELNQKNNGLNYNALVGFQQTLPWDIRLSANAIITGKSVTLQGYSTGVGLCSIGVTKGFLEDKLTLSVSGITNVSKSKHMTTESIVNGPDFRGSTITSIPIRAIQFSLSYTFGKQNVSVKSAKKTIESDVQLNTKSMAETAVSF